MKRLICFLFCVACYAQTISNVTFPTIGALTSVVEFNAPDGGSCTVDATYKTSVPETPDWSNVLPWSNRALFPTLSVIPAGPIHRRKVLFEWNTDRGSDNLIYNLQSPQATRIYVRITCGVASTIVSYVSGVYPMGLTWSPKGVIDFANPQNVPLTPSNTMLPGWEFVNTFGNITTQFQGVQMFSQAGPYLGMDTLADTFSTATGAGGWVNTSNILADDTAYAVYNGTAADKLYLARSVSQNDVSTVDWIKLRLKGCADGAAITVHACVTKDGTTCATGNKDFVIPNGGTGISACPTNGTVVQQPTGNPVYDIWTSLDKNQTVQTGFSGFLVWPDASAGQKVLLQYAEFDYSQSHDAGASPGGFYNMMSPLKTTWGEYMTFYPPRSNGWPTLWSFNPSTSKMTFHGVLLQNGNDPWRGGLITAAWSGVDPLSFYAITAPDNTCTGCAPDLVRVYYGGGSGAAATNGGASVGTQTMITGLPAKIDSFFQTNQSKYPGIADIGPYLNWKTEQVQTVNGKDYVTVTGYLVSQDTYAWRAVVQIDPGLSETQSTSTRVIAMWPTYGNGCFGCTDHSVFAGRGAGHVINVAMELPKNNPGETLQVMNIVTQMNPGDTTLQLVSPCAGSGVYGPCTVGATPSAIFTAIMPGMTLFNNDNYECAYVNSASMDSTSHVWTLNVTRNYCIVNGVATGQVTWRASSVSNQNVRLTDSYLGKPAGLEANFVPRPMVDWLRDPYGQHPGQAKYATNSHDYCANNYIGGGGGSAAKSGQGTYGCDEMSNQPSNMGVSWTNLRFAGNMTPCSGNDCETHPSMNHDKATGNMADVQVDFQPFIGLNAQNGGTSNLFAQVTGTSGTNTNLYKLSNMGTYYASTFTYNPKPGYKSNTFATLSGTTQIRDISGPGSVLDDSKPYAMCFAAHAGECAAGSAVGDVFVDVPSVTHLNCQGAEFTQGVGDLCAINIAAAVNNATTVGFIRNAQGQGGSSGEINPGGPGSNSGFDYSRPISNSNATWRLASPLNNVHTDAEGKVLLEHLYNGVGSGRTFQAATILPPVDYWNARVRDYPDTFNVAIKVPAPLQSQSNNAVVEFGYNRNLYCIGQQAGRNWDGRSEICVKGAQPIQWYDFANHTFIGNDPGNNFDFESDLSTITGVPCTTSCTVTIPVIPNRLFYYRYKLRNASGTVIYTSHPCTSEQDCMVAITQ